MHSAWTPSSWEGVLPQKYDPTGKVWSLMQLHLKESIVFCILQVVLN